jgi:transcription elongation factor GreA
MVGMASDTPRPGAAELMRSLDLLVHGPKLWGAPVASNSPGVFMAELPTAPEHIPTDATAIRKWLERVPTLMLDGERPTAGALSSRLSEFWLPNEPILFVGRSSRSVGRRLAAVYATPLGDTKPTALGYWLKTLAVLREVRVWWAATDAPEEYEDALLEQVAERNGGRLPFANLSSPSRGPRSTGLAGELREPDQAPTTTPPRPTHLPRSSRPAPRTPARRATSSRQPARRSPAPAQAVSKPVPEPTYLSAEGVAELTAELDQLRTTVRPEVIARVKAARELGDLRENGDYEAARKEQSFVEGRIQTLEALLRSTRVIDTDEPTDTVRPGSTVEVEFDGQSETWVLVGSSEADPARGRLSYQSPVGQALIGRRAGDEITVQLPGARQIYRVRSVS